MKKAILFLNMLGSTIFGSAANFVDTIYVNVPVRIKIVKTDSIFQTYIKDFENKVKVDIIEGKYYIVPTENIKDEDYDNPFTQITICTPRKLKFLPGKNLELNRD